MAWEFGGLGDSIFNYTADFHACGTCGLVYVRNIDDATLARFYTDECGYFEKAHFSVTSPANQEKYAFYARFLRENGIVSADMADIGCGRGGFVEWLARGDWQGACCGVDVDVRSMPVDATGKVTFRPGGAQHLPFEDATLTLLTYFHVLEHVRDSHALLREAARVLRPGGHILIEVPDAESYAAHPIGPAFWFSIREHIHHFTAAALVAALHVCGFSVVRVSRQILPTPEFSYPSLMVLASKGEQPGRHAPPAAADVADFAVASRRALERQAAEIAALAGKRTLTFWGCSAELFSLLPLLDARNIRLCDASARKQAASYRGMPIADPASLPVEGILVVAPYLHAAAIRSAALRLGWPEAAIHTLR